MNKKVYLFIWAILVVNICLCPPKRPPVIELPQASPVVKNGSPAELIDLAQRVGDVCRSNGLTVQELHELSMQVHQVSRQNFDQSTVNKLIMIIHNEGVPKVRGEFHGEDDRRRRFIDHCLIQPVTDGVSPDTPKLLSYLDGVREKTSPFDDTDSASPVELQQAFDPEERKSFSTVPMSRLRRDRPACLAECTLTSESPPDPIFIADVQQRADNLTKLKDFWRLARDVVQPFKNGEIDYETYRAAAWILHRTSKQEKKLFSCRDDRKKFEFELPNPEEENISNVSSMTPLAEIFPHDWRVGNTEFDQLEQACLSMTRHARGRKR